MSIPGISDSLLFSAFEAAPAEKQAVTPAFNQPILSDKDVFVASMALYLNQLHQLVMGAWKKFAESQKDIANEKTSDHRAHERKVSEEEAVRLEGQKRESEARKEAFEDEILRSGVHRQAGKFRYFQGQYIDDGRNLHIAV